MSARWTALLLAGSRPNDPLAESLGVDLKPLLPIHGEPMLLRPIRALRSVPAIAEVRVLTQQPDRLDAVISGDRAVKIEQSERTIAETLLKICDDPATPFPLLVTTADHALLTPQMIEEFLNGAEGCDVAVGVVSRTNLIARFPEAQRTWLRFGQEQYSGANLFALASPKARAGVERWRAIEQDRKKGWRVLLQLGLPLFLGAVLRIRDIHQTALGLGRRLGISLRAVVLSDPLAAVDVDKPSDHRLVSAILEGRA